MPLEKEEKDEAAKSANSLIWPKHVLISEAWCKRDKLAEQVDQDFHDFPQVNLALHSFRLNKKFWIKVDAIYRLETRFLLSYPITRSFPLQAGQTKRLPNPPVHITSEDLEALRYLHEKWVGHKICIEPQSPYQAMPVRPENLATGFIYRLALTSSDLILRQTQGYSFYERPLGKPFLVTHITHFTNGYYGTSTRVSGFGLTNFHNGPITKYFGREDLKTHWIRSQYLPVEGDNAETHDNLPIVRLGEGSPRFWGSWYVNARRSFEVGLEELLEWSMEGKERIYVREDMLDLLASYHRRLYQERKWRAQTENKTHFGGPGRGGNLQEGGVDMVEVYDAYRRSQGFEGEYYLPQDLLRDDSPWEGPSTMERIMVPPQAEQQQYMSSQPDPSPAPITEHEARETDSTAHVADQNEDVQEKQDQEEWGNWDTVHGDDLPTGQKGKIQWNPIEW